MNYRRLFILVAAAALLLPAAAWSADVPLITKEALKAAMAEENPAILDVRSGRDWSASEFKILGALRADPRNVDAWTADLVKDRLTVLYCA